jgi:hypothetical protein
MPTKPSFFKKFKPLLDKKVRAKKYVHVTTKVSKTVISLTTILKREYLLNGNFI